MIGKDKIPGNDADLRRRAEEIARAKAIRSSESLEALSPEATRTAFHELRVHQIELEMQNGELRQAQVELDAARARYFDLYDLAPVSYLTVGEKGLILEANITAALLLGVERGSLVRQPISLFIFRDDQDIYYLRRKRLFETGEPQECELRMLRKAGSTFWARLHATAALDADGATVCRIVLSDDTERKGIEEKGRRNEARLSALVDILKRPFPSARDFLSYSLGQAIRLTGSEIGFVSRYDEGSEEFILEASSAGGMASGDATPPSSRYSLDRVGIWGEAIRQRRPMIANNSPSIPSLKGDDTEPRLRIRRLLTIPILKNEGIVGAIWLANKAADYDEADILQVTLLMETVWEVAERKWAG